MRATLRRVGSWVAGNALPRIAYPVLRGHLRGTVFVLGSLSGEGAGASVYLGLVETEQSSRLISLLGAGQVFYDIGANVGYYTLVASRCVGDKGRVLSLEPEPRNLSFLDRHIKANGVTNVTVIRAACSDSDGLSSFSSGMNYATGFLGKGELLVPTVKVDTMARVSGKFPRAVKIDVEGAELRVLRGATETLKEHKPLVFLSTHSEQLRTDCTALMVGLGYEYQIIAEDGPGSELLFVPTD